MFRRRKMEKIGYGKRLRPKCLRKKLNAYLLACKVRCEKPNTTKKIQNFTCIFFARRKILKKILLKTFSGFEQKLSKRKKTHHAKMF